MFCTSCGAENPADSRFCAKCGASLVEASAHRGGRPDTTSIFAPLSATPVPAEPDPDFSADDHQGAIDALPGSSALLVVKRGPNAGSRFLLDRPVTTAGRHPDSDIFLDDVTVSRRHVEFRRENNGYSVHDVGSLNGTYVNRERIESAMLAGSDEVQIGKFRLVYLTSSVPSPVAAGR